MTIENDVPGCSELYSEVVENRIRSSAMYESSLTKRVSFPIVPRSLAWLNVLIFSRKVAFSR